MQGKRTVGGDRCHAPAGEPSLSTLMDNLNGMVYRCRNDESWTMRFVSKGCRALTGLQSTELINSRKVSFAELIHPEDRAPVWHSVQEAVNERRTFKLEYRIRSACSEEKWVRECGCGVFDSEGRLEALEGFITDITEEKTAEREIRLLGEALKSIGNAVAVTDLNNRFLFVNDAFLNTFGYSRDEVAGLTIDSLRVEDECSENLDDINRETLKGGWKGELVNRRKDGTCFPAFLSTSVVRDDYGQPAALIGVVKDLTEEKKLQRQLYQAQRLEAVGCLAGGIAHDFNNLLTVINGYSEVLLYQMSPSDPLRKAIMQIGRAGDRAASLTQQLLAFSRKQVIQPKVLNLNMQIGETERMLKRLISENIRLTSALQPDLGLIKADPSQMDQILLNLAVNARDAMPDGGELVIETANFEVDEAYRGLHPQADPGPHVMLTVTDTGDGIDSATQERIFEPFFTTKKRGQGTGLGLSTVYGIVKQNCGHILVSSEVGQGTSFKILFPRIDAETSKDLPSKGISPSIPMGSELILLVEDEPVVRDLTTTLLRRSGYRVLQAGCADEAWPLFEANQAELALLMTDVVLPGMSGCRLAERVRATKPDVAIIYLSGYTDETIERYGVRESGVAFVHKPYSARELMHLVRNVLDRPQSLSMPDKQKRGRKKHSRYRSTASHPSSTRRRAIAARAAQ